MLVLFVIRDGIFLIFKLSYFSLVRGVESLVGVQARFVANCFNVVLT